MSTQITLFIIFLASVLLWGRYLYIKTLKNSINRTAAINKIAEFAIYIPIGLQAIFLFCFALLKFIPLNSEFLLFLKGVFYKKKKLEFVDFNAFKIIYLGTLIIVLNYVLLKIHHHSKNTILVILYKLFFFGCSLFFLRLLVLNINNSLSLFNDNELSLSYKNSYLFICCLFIIFLLAIVKGTWIYKQQNPYLKYTALAARIVVFYTFLILFVSVIRFMIYAIFKQ